MVKTQNKITAKPMLISLNRIKKEGATFLRQLRIFKDKSRKGTKKQNEEDTTKTKKIPWDKYGEFTATASFTSNICSS